MSGLGPGEPAPGHRLTLRAAREATALTRDQLAASLGVVPDTVGRWERSESRPKPRYLRPLAQALDLPVSDLLATLDDGAAEAPLAENVISMPGTSQRPRTADLRPNVAMQERFVTAFLSGLETGHATSSDWLKAAQVGARLVGLDWPGG